MIISVTGHRPDKLGGYDGDINYKLMRLFEVYLEHHKSTMVITGMALGWDQAVALACINNNIPFTAAIPFNGQESMWPVYSQIVYNTMVGHAAKVVVVSKGVYSAKKMQIRNEWMVDNSEQLVAMWDGSRGGTYNCVQYAEKQLKPVTNLYQHWIDLIK